MAELISQPTKINNNNFGAGAYIHIINNPHNMTVSYFLFDQYTQNSFVVLEFPAQEAFFRT